MIWKEVRFIKIVITESAEGGGEEKEGGAAEVKKSDRYLVFLII